MASVGRYLHSAFHRAALCQPTSISNQPQSQDVTHGALWSGVDGIDDGIDDGGNTDTWQSPPDPSDLSLEMEVMRVEVTPPTHTPSSGPPQQLGRQRVNSMVDQSINMLEVREVEALSIVSEKDVLVDEHHSHGQGDYKLSPVLGAQ